MKLKIRVGHAVGIRIVWRRWAILVGGVAAAQRDGRSAREVCRERFGQAHF
jgi:hypothetical protein